VNRKRIAIATAAAAVLVTGAGGVAVASGAIGDDNEQPIEGPALEKATEAALAETGGGRVTETEQGDEESLYEVEVTLEDGSQVDVQLDENFKVVASNRDGQDDEGKGDNH
jgi:hypothetical protein